MNRDGTDLLTSQSSRQLHKDKVNFNNSVPSSHNHDSQNKTSVKAADSSTMNTFTFKHQKPQKVTIEISTPPRAKRVTHLPSSSPKRVRFSLPGESSPVSPLKKSVNNSDCTSVTLDADYHSPTKRSTLRRYVYIKEVLQRNVVWDDIGKVRIPDLPISAEEICAKPHPSEKKRVEAKVSDANEAKMTQPSTQDPLDIKEDNSVQTTEETPNKVVDECCDNSIGSSSPTEGTTAEGVSDANENDEKSEPSCEESENMSDHSFHSNSLLNNVRQFFWNALKVFLPYI